MYGSFPMVGYSLFYLSFLYYIYQFIPFIDLFFSAYIYQIHHSVFPISAAKNKNHLAAANGSYLIYLTMPTAAQQTHDINHVFLQAPDVFQYLSLALFQ